MSNFWVNSFPAAVPGGTVLSGGGGAYSTPDVPAGRDPLDARRMANGFAPGASYPDGYLGNVTWDRNQDKLAINQTRLTPNSYQRGVHKGEKTTPGDYFWNDSVNPDMGIERQARSVASDIEGATLYVAPRFAPSGNPVELLANDGKTATMTPRQQEQSLRSAGGDPSMNPVQVVDPSRRAQAARHLPRWSGAFQA